MNAGRDLDALIAEKVMGWHRGKGGAIAGPGTGYEWPAYWHDDAGAQQAPCIEDRFAGIVPWSPSTNIADAWLVVERMRALGWHCEVGTHFIDDSTWWARFGRGYYDRYDDHFEQDYMQADDTSPMAAICRASLEAIG